MSVEIRRLGPQDAALFDRIADDVFDEPIHPQRLAAYLADPGHAMIVALVDGIVIGQCAAVVHRHPDKPTELYIDEVGVAPGYQQRGVARRMLGEMFAWGRSIGCVESWVGTENDNRPARRLYESFDASGAPFVMYQYRL